MENFSISGWRLLHSQPACNLPATPRFICVHSISFNVANSADSLRNIRNAVSPRHVHRLWLHGLWSHAPAIPNAMQGLHLMAPTLASAAEHNQ
jgi:hypothetical protein